MINRSMASFKGIVLKDHPLYYSLGSNQLEIPLETIFSYTDPDGFEFSGKNYGTEGIFDFEISNNSLLLTKGTLEGHSRFELKAMIPGSDTGITTNFEVINNSAENIEDFEYTTLEESPFSWTGGGSSGWEIANDGGFSGRTSLRSGSIDHSQISEISTDIYLTEPGTVTFSYRTSTYYTYYLDEIDGDFLHFFVDGKDFSLSEAPELWGGINPWRTVSYLIGAGSHTLTWKYVKNDWAFSDDDAVWIDLVFIPGEPVKDPGPVAQNQKTVTISSYPNPFNPTGILKFDMAEKKIVSLRIYDAAGRLVSELFSGTLKKGSHSFTFDGSRLSAGIYYTVLDAGGAISAKKIMLLK